MSCEGNVKAWVADAPDGHGYYQWEIWTFDESGVGSVFMWNLDRPPRRAAGRSRSENRANRRAEAERRRVERELNVQTDRARQLGCEPGVLVNETCEACRIVGSGDTVVWRLTRHWTLNASRDAGVRPWLVLQSVDHVASPGQLSPQAAAELGPLIRGISRYLEQALDPRMVHIYHLNESSTPHVHFHFTVSFPDDEAGFLLGVPLREGLKCPKSTAIAANVAGWLLGGTEVTTNLDA